VRKKNIIVGFLLVLLSSLAFRSYQSDPDQPVFQDQFEYLTTGLFNGAFAAWKDGAQITITLAKDLRKPGDSAMRVELTGPNKNTASRDASIFRILQLLERRWTGGAAARFWLDNPSEYPLAFSFNFKEEFNEYWATSGSQIFFLENEDGRLLKENAQYGNLSVPAGYQGYVVIPFEGLTVPEWNTARGDFKMDLDAVESFALGVSIDQHYSRHFFVDDFQVISARYPYLEIQGPAEIQVPSEGELRQQYSAVLDIPDWNATLKIKPAWVLPSDIDPLLRWEDSGWLVIPSGVQSQKFNLAAEYSYGDYSLMDEWSVTITGIETDTDTPSSPENDSVLVSDPSLREKSAYEQLSEGFERWTFENRPLFVLLTVGVIMIVLAILAFFQRRMR
jgi:hypothetical protein